MSTLLSELQRDALQELMNISMGQAANALARLIEAKITLSIPKIVMVSAYEFQQMFVTDQYWFTRQSFLGSVKGEVLTLLARAGTEAIGELMDYVLPLDDRSRKELLLELANILAGACLNGFSSQLALHAKLSMPTIFQPDTRQAESFRWSSTLLLEVEFQLEGTAFDSRIVICLEGGSVEVLIGKLNELLED
ncbi:chemotaxis protein CheC [Rheinheimera texasensis]|jgi:chemotaxis protein CheC|uniref:chemotaxis protein CheC n=1 Tax=Rheinheimera texasensis TaxID=306205 RepID=UPI0004E26B41|nr:chemotaxis protein CheC [Rheinheimera texasensis]